MAGFEGCASSQGPRAKSTLTVFAVAFVVFLSVVFSPRQTFSLSFLPNVACLSPFLDLNTGP